MPCSFVVKGDKNFFWHVGGEKNIDSPVMVVYVCAPTGCSLLFNACCFFQSSIAQLVEQVAVNHLVASSSLARGARNTKPDFL